jgi:hypothetical protein
MDIAWNPLEWRDYRFIARILPPIKCRLNFTRGLFRRLTRAEVRNCRGRFLGDEEKEKAKAGEFLEARVGIEPTHKGFADLSLTTWVPRLNL